MSPTDLAQDPRFYVNLENGKPVLKKSHSSGYCIQIQLARDFQVLIHWILLFTLLKV